MTTTKAPPVPYFTYQHLSASTLLADANRIRQSIQVYYHQTLPQGPAALSEDHPTPEGLALALGWPSFRKMRDDIERILSRDRDAYRDCINTILAACALMQDYYLKHGLSNNINTTISKFISSAYFDTHEKSATTTTSHHTENRSITIRVESASPSSPEEAEEIARLEQSLTEQTAAELQSMGRSAPAAAAAALTMEELL